MFTKAANKAKLCFQLEYFGILYKFEVFWNTLQCIVLHYNAIQDHSNQFAESSLLLSSTLKLDAVCI